MLTAPVIRVLTTHVTPVRTAPAIIVLTAPVILVLTTHVIPVLTAPAILVFTAVSTRMAEAESTNKRDDTSTDIGLKKYVLLIF